MTPRILVATRKGLFTLAQTTAGGAWDIVGTDFLADNVSVALQDARDGSLYAALDHGHFGCKLHRQTKSGGDWQEIAVPVYPEKPDDEESVDQWGKPLPWSLVRIWALEAGGVDEPGVLWAGTLPGGLFRSGDHGATWHIMDTLWRDPRRKAWFGGGADLPGIHSIVVDPRDSKRVLIGVSCAGVWRTHDGGATWAPGGSGMRAEYMPPEQAFEPNVQDPHRLVHCPAAPDALWVQHHNGIFRSTDGAESWSEITNATPSAFGFAVAVHPREADTAWFVPAIKDEKRIPVDGALVVIRTRDGGRSFDILRNGLPQNHAYDIVYRHALDIDESGDRLAFGTTTGSLFVSGDQGESWAAVSNHLPPVHQVRFIR